MYRINQKLIAINLLFGSACNLRCPYCLQGDEANNKKGDPQVFLQQFEEFVKKNQIESIGSIHYWGGEPLLYMSTIKEVYLGLDRLFPNIVKHRITTNGTLIDDAYVEFVNAHSNIVTVVSLHDANISDAQWRRIAKIHRLCLSGLAYHGCNLPSKYLKRWEEIYVCTGRAIPFGIYGAHATDGCNESLWLNREDIDAYFHELRNLIYPLANLGHLYCKQVISNLVFEIESRSKINAEAKCFNDKILSIDLFGNRYFCHHDGSVGNRAENIFTNTFYLQKQQAELTRPECADCEAFPVCKGGCIMSNQKDLECYWEKSKWKFYDEIKEGLRRAV